MLLFLLSTVATQAQRLSDEVLTFEGRVSSTEALWSADRSTIYTINWFEPARVYRGVAPGDSIPVLTRGGLTDEGLLIVSHSLSFRPFTDYVVSTTVCTDCIDGLPTYWPVDVTDGYNKSAYFAKLKTLKTTPNRATNQPLPCSRATEPSTLHTKFGNVHLTGIGEELEGYIDILAKTNTEPRALHHLAATLLVDTEFFGTSGWGRRACSWR